MHDTTQQDRLIQELSPEYRIPRSVSEPTSAVAEELRQLIMLSSEQNPQPIASPRRFWDLRRRLVFAVPTVAALAAVAFIGIAGLPGSGPVGPAPARAEALRFTEDNGYLDIQILDPAADPERYQAELSQRGLDIELALAPADPDRVGRVIFMEEDDKTGSTIKVTEAPGDCTANGNCSVAIRVPLDYQGSARVVFGRTATPGETGEGDAPVLTEQQKQQIKDLEGKRVSEVREILADRGWTATYRVGFRSLEAPADKVPGSWYVYDTSALAGNVVILFVSVDGEEPPPGS